MSESYTGVSSQGRGKLRVFLDAIVQKSTQLCPPLDRKPGYEVAQCICSTIKADQKFQHQKILI